MKNYLKDVPHTKHKSILSNRTLLTKCVSGELESKKGSWVSNSVKGCVIINTLNKKEICANITGQTFITKNELPSPMSGKFNNEVIKSFTSMKCDTEVTKGKVKHMQISKFHSERLIEGRLKSKKVIKFKNNSQKLVSNHTASNSSVTKEVTPIRKDFNVILINKHKIKEMIKDPSNKIKQVSSSGKNEKKFPPRINPTSHLVSKESYKNSLLKMISNPENQFYPLVKCLEGVNLDKTPRAKSSYRIEMKKKFQQEIQISSNKVKKILDNLKRNQKDADDYLKSNASILKYHMLKRQRKQLFGVED